MGLNQTVKTAANTYITERSGTNKTAFNDSVVEGLRLYVIQKGGTPATTSINDLINQATAYYFTEQSVTPAPRGNDAIFDATRRYLLAKSQFVPASLNDRLLASAKYYIANGSGVIAAPFASVNGATQGPSAGPYDSWSVQYAASPPDAFTPNLVPFTVSRQGYDGSANTTTYLDTFYVTQGVRQPYPNQASPSALTAALSDYIYSTDTPSGSVTNNASFTSPKPIAAWVTPHRSVVGNTIGGTVVPVEIVAAHRNARLGREVASVVFSITDGTTTVTCSPISSSVVSGRTGDQNAVVAFRMPSTDISSLTNNATIMIRAQVYPWIGTAASVLDSNDGTAVSGRDFGPRYFYRSTGLAAAPYYAYVTTGGNDGTGVFSTTAATAEATPFLTIVGMFNALNSGAAGKADGVIVRIGNDGGTPFVLSGSATSRNQDCAAIIITRDPNVARANARVSFGAAAPRLRLLAGLGLAPAAGGGTVQLTTGCIRFTDLEISRTGTSAFTGEAANQLEIQWDNVDLNNNSHAATWLNNSHDYIYGMTLTNGAVASVLSAGTYEHRILRGLSFTGVTTAAVEGWWVFGSRIRNTAAIEVGAVRSASGSMIGFNFIGGFGNTNGAFTIGAAVDVTGVAYIQNVVEYTSGTQAPSMRVSADDASGNTTHICIHNNTFVGAWQAGRWNNFYDETPADNRTHILHSAIGNIGVSFYTKSDMFHTDGLFIGNWAYMYGVGCPANFSQYRSNGVLGTNEAQAYGGVGSLIGTSDVTPQIANTTLFTDYEATTYNGTIYTAGAAPPGTYSIATASLAIKGLLPSAVLSHDFAGTARPTTLDSAGAYVAP